jgi:transcription elongation factor B subunit 1
MEKKIAIAGSKTMQVMLEGNYRESENNVVRFPDISGPVLEKVIQYLYYLDKNKRSSGRLPEFHIEPEIALELLMASNFLNC